MTSIFIKTCPKDHVWLQYLLPSIEKYAEGFKDVVIVSDAGTVIPHEYLSSIKKFPVHTHYIPVPTQTKAYPQFDKMTGLGYLWQQYIKLSWHNICVADSALLLDSDEMLCKLTTPDAFKHDGKWVWTYRLWKDAGGAICWKQPTDQILGQNTPYEAMLAVGFVLTRTATINLLNHIYQTHAISNLWELVVKKKMNSFSEYNMYGSYIHSVNDPAYYYNIRNDIPLQDCIIVNWSWGGVTDEIHKKAMSYLGISI
jgi:hypothetical protein